MTTFAFVLVEIGIAVAVWRLGSKARKQQLTARTAALLAAGCALLLLLLPGIPTLAERRISGIAPEEHVRSMILMCFGDPARVPRAVRSFSTTSL